MLALSAELLDRPDDERDVRIGSELERLAAELRRRRNGNARKAPVASVAFTPEVAKAIRAYKEAFPETTMFDIGHVFNVNQGRVSEALYGKRS